MEAFKEYSPLYLSCVSTLFQYFQTILIRCVYLIAWHLLCVMAFPSRLLLQPSPTPCCTSGNLSGYILAGHYRNNPMSMQDWCRIIGKVWSSFVSEPIKAEPFQQSTRVVVCVHIRYVFVLSESTLSLLTGALQSLLSCLPVYAWNCGTPRCQYGPS